MKNYLEFEKDIKTLEDEMELLKSPGNESISEVDTSKIKSTQNQINSKLKSIYSSLNSWQKTQVARHEDRPRASFYIKKIFKDFTPLAGDRYFGDDHSVTTGFGLINNKPVLVIGQEKGEDLNTRIEKNFGMMSPEGYRKCIRLMKLADRFKIPIITFIDTPGAYPGIGAEQRGQASAIAHSIECCMSLKVPNISVIIGEGGSGGAIALASSNKVIMLENSIYSVISPEGCASILWRDPKKTLEAATAMKLSSKDLLDLNIIDEIIEEPTGGAHRDREKVLKNVRVSIEKSLIEFTDLSGDEILEKRKSKFLSIGRTKGLYKSGNNNDKLILQTNNFDKLIQKIKINKKKFILIFFLLSFLAALGLFI